MTFEFEYLNKNESGSILPGLFSILFSNMDKISPTGNSFEEDYDIWFSNVYPALKKPQREIVLMYADGCIIGYFQYYINLGVFMMEEIQIKSDYHQKGVFNDFYSWLIKRLPSEIQNVEAYSNKNNIKSQGILEHLGLKKIGESQNGSSFHYKGEYKILREKFLKK